MTPIMLERICKDIEANGGKLDKITFGITDGSVLTGRWHWLNYGQGGLDTTIVVQQGKYTYYVTVDGIHYVSHPNGGKKTKQA